MEAGTASRAEGLTRVDTAIEDAVDLARHADATVLVVGIEEGEFRDRASLGLPGGQEPLVRAVARAAAGPVVVVVIGGSAVTMPWLDDVDAVLMAWYPGEQGGHAVADALLGDVDPGGRLPITFPLAEGQLPLVYNHTPTGRGNDYLDLPGDPLFPFGYGLSYTTFEYSDLVLSADSIAPGDSVEVRVRVRNVGTRIGEEVVQLYVRDLLASRARPVIQLAGFRRVRLEPGEARVVRFTLEPDALSMLVGGPEGRLRWVVEPGTFRVLIGRSSADLRLRAELEVH
jgi:beta-glucosidase